MHELLRFRPAAASRKETHASPPPKAGEKANSGQQARTRAVAVQPAYEGDLCEARGWLELELQERSERKEKRSGKLKGACALQSSSQGFASDSRPCESLPVCPTDCEWDVRVRAIEKLS